VGGGSMGGRTGHVPKSGQAGSCGRGTACRLWKCYGVPDSCNMCTAR
jgi:hypothetical protein